MFDKFCNMTEGRIHVAGQRKWKTKIVSWNQIKEKPTKDFCLQLTGIGLLGISKLKDSKAEINI